MIYAATGHRPAKLGGYSAKAFGQLRDVAYQHLQANKPDKAITGMALGWDLAFGWAAFYAGIPVIAAVPFRGQERKWPASSQALYNNLLGLCEEVEVVCRGGYAPWKMQRRNEWMVERCDKLIACWDGSSGGTANCLEYAARVGRAVDNLYNTWKASVSRG